LDVPDVVLPVVGAPFGEVADDLRTGGGLLSRGRRGGGRGARAGEQSGAEHGGTGGGHERPQRAGAVGGWHPVAPRGGGESRVVWHDRGDSGWSETLEGLDQLVNGADQCDRGRGVVRCREVS